MPTLHYALVIHAMRAHQTGVIGGCVVDVPSFWEQAEDVGQVEECQVIQHHREESFSYKGKVPYSFPQISIKFMSPAK